MSEVSKKEVISSMLWKFFERISVQGISFIVTIVLARLLSPEEYGTIAIITVFVAIAQIVVEGGLSTALIQKKDADNLDFSTIFYSSIAVSLLLSVILYLTAPSISNFYNQPELTPILRVLSVNLLIGAINSVQVAYLSRNLLFKKMFYSSLVGAIMSGVVGISMATANFGVWSLVGQQISSQFFITTVMWFTLRWRPDVSFSWKRFQTLFNYGWKIFATNFLISIFHNVRSLIIGKLYTRDMLGFFDRGRMLPNMAISSIDSTLKAVLLPVYSKSQDNREELKLMLRRSIKTSCVVIFPLMIGLIVTAKPLVLLLMSEKWLGAVPFVQIFALALMLMPIQSINMEAIKSMGFSGTLLKIEMMKKVLEFAILFATMFISVYAIAWGTVIYNAICIIVNLYPNRKFINYGYREQLSNILPELVVSVLMGGIVYIYNFINAEVWQILIFQILSGGVVYIALCKLFKLESFDYIVNFAKSALKQSNKNE